ncbi:hypothetical protein BC629DRAFT_171972 [Irpex lacteus]|nr:hypothetical protein BC629DRAFT_171972 [Irpex lacteus]
MHRPRSRRNRNYPYPSSSRSSLSTSLSYIARCVYLILSYPPPLCVPYLLASYSLATFVVAVILSYSTILVRRRSRTDRQNVSCVSLLPSFPSTISSLFTIVVVTRFVISIHHYFRTELID